MPATTRQGGADCIRASQMDVWPREIGQQRNLFIALSKERPPKPSIAEPKLPKRVHPKSTSRAPFPIPKNVRLTRT